jgi:Uncharacterised nucleotidyltransferase
VTGSGLDPVSRLLAARNLMIDRLTAETAETFAVEGIESLVLKGPALAAWLYPDEVRPYGDSDIMVAPSDWQRAVGVLERLGFANYLEPMAHPRMESFASTAFLRDRTGAEQDNVDLHCALHGCDGDLERIWASLLASSERQVIGGAELRVPGRAALLLHVGLHAAHHVEGKPIEDLRRALASAGERPWCEALELAREYEGIPAFVSGLRLLPAGVELARRLGVEEVRSLRHELRREGTPTAEAIDALLSPGVGAKELVATVLRELLPRPEFMRWWTPLARRGAVGLAVSYPWRWIWLFAHAPRGLLAVLHSRAARRR